MIERIAVVIPARNEEARIVACLESIARAAHPGVPVDIVLVADACTDDTALLARNVPGVRVVESHARNVGWARRVGVDAAAEEWPDAATDSIWIACTDADSRVPRNWLQHHLAVANSGADVLIGTVRPDFSELPDGFGRAWRLDHRPGQPNGHVHGANLGVRASVYRRAGGFADDAEHEDTRLVERVLAAGGVSRASDVAEVVTSGRRVGRTAGGYAGFLRAQLDGFTSREPLARG